MSRQLSVAQRWMPIGQQIRAKAFQETCESRIWQHMIINLIYQHFTESFGALPSETERLKTGSVFAIVVGQV